jgi:hypothetical protein
MTAMKGWLTLVLAGLVFGTVAFSMAGCSEDSGWSGGMNGMPMQGNGSPGVESGAAPAGSGAVDYVPQGNY